MKTGVTSAMNEGEKHREGRNLGNRPCVPLGLLLLALSTVFLFGNDRGHFYRPGHHDWVSSHHLAIALNLSPEHGFLMFHRQHQNADGSVSYQPYNRFPIGGYALLKLATLPFSDDLSAMILAARMLMLLCFAGAALLAYLALLRLMPSPSNRWIALTATLLAFASPYCLYYNDMIYPKAAMDLFGVMLTFHGMVVFVQEHRLRQLLVKACLALLLGWHVFALLLTFITLGVTRELVRARSARPGHASRKHAPVLSVATPLVGRYVLLGAVTLCLGGSLLTLNLANEWRAMPDNRALTELPTANSMLKRIGVDGDRAYHRDPSAWPSFLERQFLRIGGGISLPFSVASRVNGAAALNPFSKNLFSKWVASSDAIIGYVMSGACLASLIGLAFIRRLRRHGLLLATLALSGFCWSLPMRFYVAFHDFESLFYIGIPLVLFSLALLGVRHLAGGSRLLVGLAVLAVLVFVSSAWEMGRVGHNVETAEFQKAIITDFEAIRQITAGRRVAVAMASSISEFNQFAGARHALNCYLAGSFIRYYYKYYLKLDTVLDERNDFLIMRHRATGIPTLTPDNRVMFLYDLASLASVPAASLPRPPFP